MIHTGIVTVYVKGQELKTKLMTEPEIAAIIECVDDLFRTYGSKMFFDTFVEEDEEGNTVLLTRCFEETPEGQKWIPYPKEWETKTLAFANRKTYRLFGDRIPISPRQYGLSPWEFVEVKLTNSEEE